MTRDEGTSTSYRKRDPKPVPAVPVTSKQHAAIGRQPVFITPDGVTVQAISLDGVPQYQIKRGPYLVAHAKNITEVAQYVDLAELQEVRDEL